MDTHSSRRSPAFILALAFALSGCTSSAPRAHTTPTPASSVGTAHQRITARVLDVLPSALSREVAVADGSSIVIAGGLDPAGKSRRGVFRFSPITGALSSIGTLALPTHDAAGAMIGGSLFLFGGGETKTVDAVQKLGGPAAHVVAHLPQPRSDLSVVTDGARTYIVGGYDGARMTPGVLETTDGTHFKVVGSLPVPVRYAAVTAFEGVIYVFGGVKHDGSDTDAVQRFDPSSGHVEQIARLPRALSHASAAVIGGQLVVLGGRAGKKPLAQIMRFDPAQKTTAGAAMLPRAVSDGAIARIGGSTYLVGGEGPASLNTVITLRADSVQPVVTPARGTPFVGALLVADRGNNRLIVMDATKHVTWIYPDKNKPAPPGGFYFPDDAFFVRHGSAIIINQEENETVVEIEYPSGKVLWQYGHPHVIGTKPGYLHEPDDAYELKDGRVIVADARNCRIVMLGTDHRFLRQFGKTRSCVHHPPQSLASPNGDTPLTNGHMLISETRGYITELTLEGKLVWSTRTKFPYPSDPQQIGPNRYLAASYARPGGLYEFDRAGKILWSYHPSRGNAMLDHPSLAEVLPSGLICVNDDRRHRMVIIDPHTKKIVWQYGVTDHPGTRAGSLRIPDGFDLLAPDGSTPTHLATA